MRKKPDKSASISRQKWLTGSYYAFIGLCAIGISVFFYCQATQNQNHLLSTLTYVVILGFLGGAVILPRYIARFKDSIPKQSVFEIVDQLLQSKDRQILLTMPLTSTGHVPMATDIAGILNQFGREAIVIDMDLCHRLLSRKIPLDYPDGVYQHLTTEDLKKPYLDPMSGARIIPLEATVEADKVVELSQVVQRMHRIWERWPNAVVILDLSQWHEAYHALLPDISQVVFYVPPKHQTNPLLPQVFQSKYPTPVSLVAIQPET